MVYFFWGRFLRPGVPFGLDADAASDELADEVLAFGIFSFILTLLVSSSELSSSSV